MLTSYDGSAWICNDIYCDAAWRTFVCFNHYAPKYVLEAGDLMHAFADLDITLSLLQEIGARPADVSKLRRLLGGPCASRQGAPYPLQFTPPGGGASRPSPARWP